ncbi:MAG: MBOAT family O-acyltransferase [Rheinheimera sp.]
MLVVSSLFFYAWWELSYLPLLLLSIGVNYLAARRIQTQPQQASVYLWFGILFNLGLLGYFKYSYFVASNLILVGIDLQLQPLLLPLAISFFTFQQLAFLVDTYKNKATEHNFLNYMLFVTFFPQLIAGPIVHHRQMMPQFSNIQTKSWNDVAIASGLVIFSIGLFKKVVIADEFAIWANAGFDNTTTLSFIEGWVTSFSYSFQLYYDFSGYSDMAVGLALLFNIKLPVNFNSPYKALSIQDFWRRWHITLSEFLRDYVYIPLGGNKVSDFRVLQNLMLTFIIGGIWHGASWMFVIWGALHGAAIVVHRLWQTAGLKMPMLVAWFCTFMFVNFSWVAFRAQSWSDATKVWSSMADINGFLDVMGRGHSDLTVLLYQIGGSLFTPLLLVFALVATTLLPNSHQISSNMTKPRVIFSASLLFIALYSMLGAEAEFLYFNF